MRKISKIVTASDLHGNFAVLNSMIQDKVQGDLFIYAGDITRYGREKGFIQFFDILDKMQFRHKILIAGNHDISLCPTMDEYTKIKHLRQFPCSLNRQLIVKELKKRCFYLQNEMIEIEGIKIYGTPHSSRYGSGAFQYQLQNQGIVYGKIPLNVDLLITHQPPYGILDFTRREIYSGSKLLRKKVFQIKPILHLFGHIHEGKGVLKSEGITFLNTATELTTISWPQLILQSHPQ